MTGIVERLRSSAAMVRDDVFQSEPDVLDEAADTIESLREALEGMVALDEVRDLMCEAVHKAAREKARAALSKLSEPRP